MDLAKTIAAYASHLMGLRPGEGRRTAMAGVYHLAFVAAVVLVKSASNALVVARFRVEALPPLYIASALATGLAAWAAAYLDRRRAPGMPRQGLLWAAAALLGLASATYFRIPAAVVALYLLGETCATIVSIRFWGAASELFDQRANRRIFGVLAAAGMVGAIVAGLAAQLLGGTLGAVGLLPLAALLLLGSAAASRSLRRANRAAAAEATAAGGPSTGSSKQRPSARDVRTYLLKNHYPRALATLMLLLAALTAVADYLFRFQAGERYGEAELAALFGALNLWMGVVAVLFQVGAAGRILERFGVFRYLLITPMGSALASIGCLFVPGMGPAFGLRLIESAGSLSLNPAAFQLLYGPIPDSLRPRIRALVDGLVKKVGFASGGVLLLVLGSRASVELLVAAVVGVVAVYVVILAISRRFYVVAIEDRLAPAVNLGANHLRSAEARTVLRSALSSDEPVRVLTSIALLRDDPRFDPLPFLPRLLGHPDSRVRRSTVALVHDRRISQAVPQLERIFAGDRPEIRYEAALALGKLVPERARELLLPWLDRNDSPLAGAAIAALVPPELASREGALFGEGAAPGDRGPPEVASAEQASLVATRALLDRLERPGAPVQERIETARALGRLGPSAFGTRLAFYLADEDPNVRRVASAAAGRILEPALVPALCRLLADRSCRAAARTALARYGDAVVPALSTVLDDRSEALVLRLEVPRVLRKVGTSAAARALLFSNIQEHAYLRFRIATNLSRLHDEHPEIEVDLQRLKEATFRRLRTYEYYLPLYRDLEAALPPHSVLVRALGDRMQQNLEVIFRLLHIRHSHGQVLSAWRRFSGGDARERAYALELLENLVEEELRRPLLPALERYHRLPEPWGGVPAKPERGPARVLELTVSNDVVLRALAIFTAGQIGLRLPNDETEDEHLNASVIERVFLLEGAEIFARCDIDDLVALATIGKESSFRNGEIIFREGEEANALFVVLQGRVRFEKGGSEVLEVGVRDAFGETSLLERAPRPVTAVAVAPEVRVLAIDRQDFLDLIADRPELLRGIFEAVTRHLRSLIDVAAAGAEAGKLLEARPRRAG
ncbi:Npt1/Npt2 family nucleotide transporter [Vulgatibacter incomptus]|uniref:ADP,ATP carrier protein n=1 Tax=Vulgatibacter incomptus TaxID=1391653 RepID=A0A0K1PCN9_9BACT|nr:Npt1/Npt2 family nucleotide transporter [Vulgatibacter incomptus]AKU90884.1 cAMP-binding protein [Vulgatibacter incomptus]